MFYIWLIVLSFLLTRVNSQEHEAASIANETLIDLSNQDWNEWSECSDSCGGCGIQNRTLILSNGTRIVHARHCNLEPCMNDKEPCCKPFKLENGKKCLLSENDKSKWNCSNAQENDATTNAWESIKDVEFSPSKILSDVKLDENDTIFNATNETNIYLNYTRNIDNDRNEGSGEEIDDDKIDYKTNNTVILEIRNKTMNDDVSSSRVSKKKTKMRDVGKGYNRKGYKRRQSRYRQHSPAAVSKLHDSREPQKAFDTIYEYEYLDYYYFY